VARSKSEFHGAITGKIGSSVTIRQEKTKQRVTAGDKVLRIIKGRPSGVSF
jgi:hypothetical protein